MFLQRSTPAVIAGWTSEWGQLGRNIVEVTLKMRTWQPGNQIPSSAPAGRGWGVVSGSPTEGSPVLTPNTSHRVGGPHSPAERAKREVGVPGVSVCQLCGGRDVVSVLNLGTRTFDEVFSPKSDKTLPPELLSRKRRKLLANLEVGLEQARGS